MKKKQNVLAIRDEMAEQYEDIPLLFMDPAEYYDSAIVGVIEGKAHAVAVAYDYDKVIKANMRQGMDYEEAVEYFEYNQIGAYVGEHTPVFLKRR
jgi:leucyl aminopeptidase (aminopeptidase T)